MNKVWILPSDEAWICDRMCDEWTSHNPDIVVANPNDASVIWLFSDWRWKHMPRKLLQDKFVVTTVHHIVMSKFTNVAQEEFADRDTVTDVYHVFNKRVLDDVKKLTQKPVYMIPYWANGDVWHKTEPKADLRRRYDLPKDAHLIGSFQRDTEGFDLITPKLEKGPDLFADYVIHKASKVKDVHVILAGWRRQYVISRLNSANVPYTYIERPPLNVVNDLYQTLDIYPVTSRCEGGPQSLIECGLLGVPVVSRPVGIAEQVLPSTSINDDVSFAIPAIPFVDHMKIPSGFAQYRDFFADIKVRR